MAHLKKQTQKETNILDMETDANHNLVVKTEPAKNLSSIQMLKNIIVYAAFESLKGNNGNNTDCNVSSPIPTSKTLTLDIKTGAKYHRLPIPVFDFLKLKQTKILGSGSNGQVLLVEDATNSDKFKFAAKVFSFNNSDPKKNKNRLKTFHKECGILQSIKHENIVEVVLGAVGPSYGVMMLQYFPDGPLYEHISNISDDLAWRYFINILSAVQYIHLKRIVHRDIKLDNILVKHKDVFLTDFGLAERLPAGGNFVIGFAGTDEFVAPEVLGARGNFGYYDGFKADSYATGIYLWCLLMQSDPELETKCWASLEKAINSGKDMDPMLVECARLLLLEDPKERVSVDDLLEGLKENHILDELGELGLELSSKVNKNTDPGWNTPL